MARAAPRVYPPRMTRGEEAERKVLARLTAALPDAYRVYPNVCWTAPTRPGVPATDGEADVVIAHPELGILVVEVKSGEPTRDASGQWWLGPNRLDRSPFEQAKRNKYELAKKVASMPGWPHEQGPIAGHAVAFPSVDLAAAGHARPSMGEDAPPQMSARDGWRPRAIGRSWSATTSDWPRA